MTRSELGSVLFGNPLAKNLDAEVMDVDEICEASSLEYRLQLALG